MEVAEQWNLAVGERVSVHLAGVGAPITGTVVRLKDSYFEVDTGSGVTTINAAFVAALHRSAKETPRVGF